MRSQITAQSVPRRLVTPSMAMVGRALGWRVTVATACLVLLSGLVAGAVLAATLA